MVRNDPFRKARGQAIVEFAFVMMVLFFLLFGISELARVLYTYNTLTQTTRAAARWAVVNVRNNLDTTHIDMAKNIVVYGNTDATADYPRLPGLTTGMVDVQIQTIEEDIDHNPMTHKVSVRVSGYQFQFMVGFLPSITVPAYETSLYTESMGVVPK